MYPINLLIEVKAVEDVFISPVSILFTLHGRGMNQHMVTVVSLEIKCHAIVHNGIATDILHARYIEGIQNIKCIHKPIGALTFIYQMFVIFANSIPCLHPDRDIQLTPVTGCIHGRVSEIIIEYAQIILTIHRGIVFHIGYRMLSGLRGGAARPI